jgi:ADP-ribose pyrophosphatase YjhB (NUDIX family)
LEIYKGKDFDDEHTHTVDPYKLFTTSAICNPADPILITNLEFNSYFPHGKLKDSNLSKEIKFSDNRIFNVAAVGILNSAGQILAGFNIKRQVWDIPQGVVEVGELPVEAAQRELYEETNIKVELDDLETIAHFKHKTAEFIKPWETNLYLANSVDISDMQNMELAKCKNLAWYAPVQLPQPRGLSLRVFLELLGK